MKSKNFILLITLWVSIHQQMIFAQEIWTYRPLEFENLEPKWSSVLVDSSIMGHKITNPRDKHAGFDGYSHIYASNMTPLFKDGYQYRVNWTAYDTDLSGGIIEKVDLSDGKIIWKSVFDLRTNTKREFIKKAEIYNNNLVLYNIEITDKDLVDIAIPIVFAFEAKGLLKVREYDLLSGKLLKVYTSDSLANNNRILSSDLIDRIQLNRIDNDNLQVLEHYHRDNNGSLLLIDTISMNGVIKNAQDTIKSFFTNVDWGDCRWSSVFKMVTDDHGILHYIDAYTPGLISIDAPACVLRSFKNGKEISTINLNFLNTDNHVAAWTLLDVNDNYVLINALNLNKTRDYIILDKQGALIGKYKFFSRNSGDNIPALGPNGSLIFSKTGKDAQGRNSLDFYQSDNDSESFKLISSFTIKNPKHQAIPSRLINLDNGDYLLDVMHTEEQGIDTRGRFHTSFRISPDQIGIPTATEEHQKLYCKLVPNPTHDKFEIIGDVIFDEVSILNLNGICVKKFRNKLEGFDVTDLGSGVYLCKLVKNNTPILVLKFVKF